jgi:putative transposase
MDGRGRALDNAFIERLWRTVKYENIYLKDYATVDEVYEGLSDYFWFYNRERFHQALDNQTPYQVYHWGPMKRTRRNDVKSRRGVVTAA